MGYILIILVFVLGIALNLWQLPKITNSKKSEKVLVTGVLIVLLLFVVFLKECNDEIVGENHDEVARKTSYNIDSIKNEQRKWREESGLLSDPCEIAGSGFSFYLVLEYSEISDLRRKFLFDLGESEHFNRISLYFDLDNNIIFRIIDKNGESFICKAPRSSYIFNPNAPFIIYADCGTSFTYSYMRLLISGQEVFRNSSDSEIDFLSKKFTDTTKSTIYAFRRLNEFVKPQPFVDGQLKGSVLADMNGHNKSDFYFYEFVIRGGILCKEKIDALWIDARRSMKYYQRIKELLKFEKTYYKFKYGKLEAVK